jgi:hypothetical protein
MAIAKTAAPAPAAAAAAASLPPPVPVPVKDEPLAPAAAVAEPPAAEPAAIGGGSCIGTGVGGVITVKDAKALVATKYSKLHSRFNYAFHGHDDSTPLAEVVDVIRADVHTWLQSMPDNFKTTNHALSRPKFGLLYVLGLPEVQEALGADVCAATSLIVESSWDECKRDLVVAKDDAPVLESEDELRTRNEELVAKVDILTSALLDLLAKNYDTTVTTLVETLLKRT